MSNLAKTHQGRSVAERNRQIRQDALREQLAAQGHLQHVILNIQKIECLADDDRLNQLIEECADSDEEGGACTSHAIGQKPETEEAHQGRHTERRHFQVRH